MRDKRHHDEHDGHDAHDESGVRDAVTGGLEMKHKGHHDGHDGHDGLKFRMRLPSPLSADVEALVTRTIDCAMDIHRKLGPGYLESIYEKAMCIALEKAGMAFECEKPILVYYEGVAISGQRVDLIVDARLVVELKAVQRLDSIHYSQVVSYLRTMKLRAGLLINFHETLLHHGIRRIVL